MNKLWNLFYLLMLNLVSAQDCLIEVPNDLLSTGMFEPWFVSTKNGSNTPCSQLVPDTAVFVEVTILDKDTGSFFIYNPLVVDKNSTLHLPIKKGILPNNSEVVIHFGSNGETISLLSNEPSANCVDGLENSEEVFGQFAYCNAKRFFQTVSEMVDTKRLVVPQIGWSKIGNVCPTVRSFEICDQDQSDNVLSQYLLVDDSFVLQNTNENRLYVINSNRTSKIVSNGSDNRLLSKMIYPSIGCIGFEAPDLIEGEMKSSLALNEIHAKYNVFNINDEATIPANDPMVLSNGEENLEKVNLYREGVFQDVVYNLTEINGVKYCEKLSAFTVPFLKLYKREFISFQSPNEEANNLMNFLALRFENTYGLLDCENLTGQKSPIYITMKDENGTVIQSNIFENVCGVSYDSIECDNSCPNGLDSECEDNSQCFLDVNEICLLKKRNLTENTNIDTNTTVEVTETSNRGDVKSASSFIIVNVVMMTLVFGLSCCFNL